MRRRLTGGAVAVVALALTLDACAPADDGNEEPMDAASSAASAHPTLRSVGHSTISLGFEDITDPDLDLAAVDAQFRAMGVDTVAISAGRADWTSFAWEDHEDRQAPVVAGTVSDAEDGAADGTADRLADRTADRTEQADPFGRAVEALGTDRSVVAVVDVFVGRYLEEHPELAAQDSEGERSEFQVSLTELTQGAHGDAIVEMVGELAAREQVTAVTLTELHYDDYGVGDDDLAMFRQDTGAQDWPRRSDGAIDWRDDAVAQWRSERIAGFVTRASDAAHANGADLLVDVRSPRDGGTAVFGQDYAVLDAASDGLVVWYYPGLSAGADGSGWSVARTAEYLREEAGVPAGRAVLSVGLWDSDGTLPADELAGALRKAEDAGFVHRWVTPYSLLEDEHVEVLAEDPPPGR